MTDIIQSFKRSSIFDWSVLSSRLCVRFISNWWHRYPAVGEESEWSGRCPSHYHKNPEPERQELCGRHSDWAVQPCEFTTYLYVKLTRSWIAANRMASTPCHSCLAIALRNLAVSNCRTSYTIRTNSRMCKATEWPYTSPRLMKTANQSEQNSGNHSVCIKIKK